MTTMTEAQTEAIQDRTNWAKDVRTFTAEIGAQLAALMYQDYRHQTGTRGVDQYPAYDIIQEHAEITLNELFESAKTTVTDQLIKEGRI